jgi:LPXTG-motif cell wall-anchored protein
MIRFPLVLITAGVLLFAPLASAATEARDAGDGSATGSDSGSTLPATGLDAGGLLALGLMTLALGALLRRRSAGAG